MKICFSLTRWLALVALLSLMQASTAFAQGTAFTYQGQLQNNGSPVSGSYNLTFTLFNTNTGGEPIAGPVTNSPVRVINGLFTVVMDFGPGVFTGATNWLEIAVEPNGGSAFTTLAPRQQLTPVPYAIMASSASDVIGTISAAQLSGLVPNASLGGNYSSVLAFPNGMNRFGGTFFGNGAYVTNLNAGNLSSGTVPLAQLPGAVVTNTETGVALGGMFNGDGGGLTNLNAAQLTSGTIPLAQLPSSVLTNGASGVSLSGAFNGNGTGLTNLDASQLTSIGNAYGGSGNFFVGPSGTAFMIGSFNSGFSAALDNNWSGSDNTANGWGAMQDNASGSDNTASGFEALYGNTSGSDNIALGSHAGMNLTTGSSNIDIGNQGQEEDNNIIRIGSGQSQTFIAGVINGNGTGLTDLNASQLTSIGNANGGANNFFVGSSGNSTLTGSFNTANGVNALSSDMTGNANTANGYYALSSDTNGSANVADGLNALRGNASGSYNTAVGVEALAQNMTGSANTANGYHTLLTAQGTNNIALGYLAGINFMANESSNIDIGNPGVTGDNNIIRIGSGQSQTCIAGVINGNGGGLTNLSVPAASLTGTLPLAQLPATVITNGANGVSLSGNVSGNGGGLTNLNASQLTSIGNTDGGYGNFFVGPSGNPTMSGHYNTAIGADALYYNMSGSANTANGSESLFNNTSGGNNTANGVYALYYNMSGSANTANGASALWNNTSGYCNTANGFAALYWNASGSNNTANGVYALNLNSSGSANIALGYRAGFNISTGSSNIDIGNEGLSTDTNIIRIGSGQSQTFIAGVINGNGGGLTNIPASALMTAPPAWR